MRITYHATIAIDQQLDVGDGKAGADVDDQPGLKVVPRNDLWITDQNPVIVSIRRPEVDENVEDEVDIAATTRSLSGVTQYSQAEVRYTSDLPWPMLSKADCW